MPLLADTFRARDSRVTKTVVAIDLTNSTAMKEQQPEANWLNTYAWFFDLLTTTLPTTGKIIKYTGDGAMAIFGDDSPADAINWAIEVQESMAEAQEKKVVSCDCSIGIAYGEMVEFETADGRKDYIGTTVDKAFRLCSVANSKAVFVDPDTCAAAAMNRVRCRIGLASVPRRTVADYQGQVESVKVKGFSNPVEYYEMLWGTTRYSVKPPIVTELSSGRMPPAAIAPPPVPASARVSPAPANPPAAAGWLRGVITSLNDRFGFIKSQSGEDFWFNSTYLFRHAHSVRVSDAVWFIPANALTGAKNRRASAILPLGSVLDGKLERVSPQGYGFVLSPNDRGETKQFFVYLGDATPWSAGMEIEFRISENSKGISGVEPRRKAA
jgi:class 3 adenylate cyclase